MSKIRYQHDATYKNLFKDPDMVESILRRFAPADVVAEMDFQSLEPFSTEHVTEDGRERRNDIVWRINIKDSVCYLLFLLEFQSREDWWMAVRILAYTALLWQDIIKADRLKAGDKLPLVFPLVLYNGGKAWKAPTDLRDLLPTIGKTLENCQPRQQYFILDAGHVPQEMLAGNNDLATLLIRFERAQHIENFDQILNELCKIIPDSPHLHRAFINFLGSNVFRRTGISENILHCNTVQEAYAMLADLVPNWEKSCVEKGISIGKQEGFAKGISIGKEEGISIGKQEGISIGEARGISIGMKNVLQDILTHRFGNLPDDVVSSIDGISNMNELKKLSREAYQASSFQAFRELLEQLPEHNSGNNH